MMHSRTHCARMPDARLMNHQRQHGIVVWMMICLLFGASLMLLSTRGVHAPLSQQSAQLTQVALSRAHAALLGYAYQSLGVTACESNCPRPGDLPCPDRNLDGVAETSCSQASQRLGRLPWKTLGVGELRDGSGELLWYAVANAYKNNPRILPLNLDTPGSWQVRTHAVPGGGILTNPPVVAVVIAPNAPLTRQDGFTQTRSSQQWQQAKQYLDLAEGTDNAVASEQSTHGLIAASTSPTFNDVLRVVTAQQIHAAMQQQVMSLLKNLFLCASPPCTPLPAAASLTDASCLGHTAIVGGCVSNGSAPEGLGRLPLTADGRGPLAGTSILDGTTRHHWFQQNGWREQVWIRVRGRQCQLLVTGEPLANQWRDTPAQKGIATHYLEADTLARFGLPTVGASPAAVNDMVWETLR